MDPPSCRLFTKEEMLRRFRINQVLKDYADELNYERENKKAKSDTNASPSKEFISARELRDFHAWCPVNHLPTLIPIITL